MNHEQETLLRLKQIVGDRATGEKGLIPIGKSAWWAGVADGKFPQPVRIPGVRITAWRRSDIDRLIASL
jgi:predicted DNA-binding transcriptional regulator AlpA